MTQLLPALLGGALIGTAVALLLLLNGRIAGISGIVGGLWEREERSWRALFLAGLLAGAFVAQLIVPGAIGGMKASIPVLGVAGVLVGLGTRMAGGCTSGHGVCGTSRASVRSIVATLTFMVVAGAVVFFVRRGT